MTPLTSEIMTRLTAYRHLTAQQLAEGAGADLEEVYASLVHLESLGLARVRTQYPRARGARLWEPADRPAAPLPRPRRQQVEVVA